MKKIMEWIKRIYKIEKKSNNKLKNKNENNNIHFFFYVCLLICSVLNKSPLVSLFLSHSFHTYSLSSSGLLFFYFTDNFLTLFLVTFKYFFNFLYQADNCLTFISAVSFLQHCNNFNVHCLLSFLVFILHIFFSVSFAKLKFSWFRNLVPAPKYSIIITGKAL